MVSNSSEEYLDIFLLLKNQLKKILGLFNNSIILTYYAPSPSLPKSLNIDLYHVKRRGLFGHISILHDNEKENWLGPCKEYK